MSGNAHANRQRRRPSVGHNPTTCIFCKKRPKFGDYKNTTGHRRNTKRKRRSKKKSVTIKLGVQ